MVKVDKQVSITISGREVELLSHALELARHMIEVAKQERNYFPCGYDEDQIREVKAFMNQVWDSI